jgi:cation transport ATPase
LTEYPVNPGSEVLGGGVLGAGVLVLKVTHWGPAETLVVILWVHVRCQPATAVLASMLTSLPE